jgi:glycosyltransferase involved in cell wall biosynthesis
MRILFLSHYFPPEVNAPASRTYENTKRWVRAGHVVTVLTCAPNHPNGVVYPGYKNRWWQWEEKDGFKVLRVKTYLGPNKGSVRRILNYVSFMFSAILFSFLTGKADVVVSTSPQFFCGMAGAFVAAIKRAPWVLEIRDLWPESIAAVEAISNPRIIRMLEKIERWMYLHADRIVSVTDSFVSHFVARGVAPERIAVIKNGADLTAFSPAERENQFRQQYGFSGKFIASYVGTHGMAHALDTVLDAAQLLQEEADIVFLLIGDGAERERLVQKKETMGLHNLLMVSQLPKERMPEVLAASDACLVHLRRTDLFKSVIPSKIFEAMAMERPIILGVEGESKTIIEAGRCGLCIEPENAREMADAVLQLHKNALLAETLGKNGRTFVAESFNRDNLAANYLDVLSSVVSSFKGVQ